MAVSAVPGSLLGRIARDSATIRTAVKARAAQSPVARHFLTTAALAVADFAAFGHSTFTGLLVLAGSLLVLDYKLQA